MPGLVNAAFGLAGVLMMIFVAVSWPVLREDVLGAAAAVFLVLTGISLVGAGLFPCDPGCPIAGASPKGMTHHVFAVLLLLFAALTPWVTAVYRKAWAGYGRFVYFSLVIGTILLELFILLPFALWLGWAGLLERLFLLLYLVWLVVFGFLICPQL